MNNLLPPGLRQPLVTQLQLNQSGKVRETYGIPDYPELRLVVATDRISALDFVFNARVPQKGEVLTLLNVFFTQRVLQRFPTDIHLFGRDITTVIPDLSPDLCRRSTIVRKAEMVPIEAIVRGYLTGSGLVSYREEGRVSGHILPPDLKDGSQLPVSLFTPTTKAEVGHDLSLNVAEVRKMRHGREIEQLSTLAYEAGVEFARSKGLVLADTKFEFGTINGELTLCDEKLTPDSSRYWEEGDRLVALRDGRTPASHDKQYFRNFAIAAGVKKLRPEIPADVAQVHSIVVPEDVIERTSKIYVEIAEKLIGMSFHEAQRQYLGL